MFLCLSCQVKLICFHAVNLLLFLQNTETFEMKEMNCASDIKTQTQTKF